MTPDAKQIAKLPKWAQDHIESLERQRDTAVRKMNDTLNKEPAPFYVEDMVCLKDGGPDYVRHYIKTDRMVFSAGGLKVDMIFRRDGGRAGAPVLDIQYNSSDHMSRGILIQPRSFQQLYIYLPDKPQ